MSQDAMPGKPPTAKSAGLPLEALEHMNFLHRLARLQLSGRTEAEDAVQETYLAALKGWDSYSRATPIRAWLVGILRHKIVDLLRQRDRYVSLDQDIDAELETLHEPGMFTAEGSWNPAALLAVEPPDVQVSRQALLELVELCMSALPANTAKVFLMREYLGMDSTEIAAKTALSQGNIRVVLHRARLRLRACVVQGWGEIL